MYVVEDKGEAIAFMLAALFFLGTWPAVMTLLERRGRLPQHTYLDYSITNLLAAVIIALTFGQIGSSTHDMPNFFTQLSQNNGPSIGFAMIGGLVLSLGNLATQYAWAFVGLSVTEVVSSSITVVVGTTMNYFLDDRINRADILFSGVGCFLIAVCLGSAVHASNAADNEKKLDASSIVSLERMNELVKIPFHLKIILAYVYRKAIKSAKPANGILSQGYTGTEETQYGNLRDQRNDSMVDEEIGRNVHQDNSVKSNNAKAGSADFLKEVEKRRSIKVMGANAYFGLGIVFFSGICFSLFSPAFNLATNDQWHTLKSGVPHLVVYTAFFYFSISCFVIAIILNIIFLYRPILGLPKSSFTAYLSDWQGRHWALLAGFLCGFGNGFQFMGGQAAGYAAADSVQALPLVSTFWGILLFGEYRRSSRKTYSLLGGMLFMFVVAVGVLMASSGKRKTS